MVTIQHCYHCYHYYQFGIHSTFSFHLIFPCFTPIHPYLLFLHIQHFVYELLSVITTVPN